MNYPALFLDYCSLTNIKLTSLRKSILFILWQAQKPLKAYEILDALLKIKQNAKPPTVYRVLDYFAAKGLVHKIESIQSYTLCHEPAKQHPSEVLMVCDLCHEVDEFYDLSMHALVQKLSNQNHFHIGEAAIELKGICKKCCTAAGFHS